MIHSVRRVQIAIAAGLVALASSAGVARQGGWRANPDVVARLAAQRPQINYDEARVPPYRIADPLIADGNIRVTTPAEWRARRQALLQAFREHVYGRSPGEPEGSRFDVLEHNPAAMDGAATLTRVAIVSTYRGRTHRFELVYFLPRTPLGRRPVFLLINNRALSNTDPTRKERSGFWPAEEIVARGYGIAALQYGELAPDDKDRFREGVIALFDGSATGDRSPDASGAISAWAWGASRAMDYFVTAEGVDATRIAVVGHSRGGKAALWAGAQDERFALTISNESGEGGASLSRRHFGETLAELTRAFPHWFNTRYPEFAGREADLPVDQHLLLSLAAPRALYVASADEDLWADPRGEFEALAASSPVFQLFGDPSLAADAMPALDTPLVVGRRGYHVRRGGHNLTPYDWARFADFADSIWKR
jgi:hypothetical protein